MPHLFAPAGPRLFLGPSTQSKQFNSSPHSSHLAQYSLSCLPAGHSCSPWHRSHAYIASSRSRLTLGGDVAVRRAYVALVVLLERPSRAPGDRGIFGGAVRRDGRSRRTTRATY